MQGLRRAALAKSTGKTQESMQGMAGLPLQNARKNKDACKDGAGLPLQNARE
jgi:hypothetical protein